MQKKSKKDPRFHVRNGNRENPSSQCQSINQERRRRPGFAVLKRCFETTPKKRENRNISVIRTRTGRVGMCPMSNAQCPIPIPNPRTIHRPVCVCGVCASATTAGRGTTSSATSRRSKQSIKQANKASKAPCVSHFFTRARARPRHIAWVAGVREPRPCARVR